MAEAMPLLPETPPASSSELTAASESEEAAKAYIYFKESSNNPQAINPSSGACGLGQALPCSKMPCELTDRECQDNFFTQYMLRRYGSWVAAMHFHKANNWW